MNLESCVSDGVFDPRRIAATLLTNAEDLARSAGLGKDAIQRAVRLRQPRTQKRLRELVEVLNKVEPRFGTSLVAYAWFRSEPLPGFSGQTAMQLVQAGRAHDVLDYIDAVDAGIHA
ncbi:MAG: DUF2384 domain-containing protein [Sphingomonadales bacterium]|nr:DUF2384 domain-containing protein [Sphingomonadales bacterium]MDE2170326.1 DUF2384 domain-containing protein [Sphingomonadales bacterium]